MTRSIRKHIHAPVLALDASYMPMVEIPRRKAQRALATGRAQALDLRTWERRALGDVASGPLHAVVFPGVKALPEARPGFGRGLRSVLRRDGHRCQYGGCERRGTTVDHVIPRCQGGPSTWGNLVACCQPCNARKGGRTPEQAGMALKRPILGPRAILLERLHRLAREA